LDASYFISKLKHSTWGQKKEQPTLGGRGGGKEKKLRGGVKKKPTHHKSGGWATVCLKPGLEAGFLTNHGSDLAFLGKGGNGKHVLDGGGGEREKTTTEGGKR